jgi:tight adherence protein C
MIFDTKAELWLVAVVVAIAVLSGFRLLRLGPRAETQRLRLEGFRGASSAVQYASPSWHRRLGRVVAASPIIGTSEQQRLINLLASAGIKGRSNLASFVASKLVGAVILAGLAWLVVGWQQWPDLMIQLSALGAALMFGWRLPDIILNRLAKQRRMRLEKGFPDALDLLVVCAEAGLSLNQSIEEISQQLRSSNRDVADEFAATAAELQVSSDFNRALDNLVQRTGLDDLRSLIAMLKQSLAFGTPLAESMRLLASQM